MRSEFWVLGVSSTVTSTDPGGSRELLDCECRSWLERRGKELLELDVEVSRLENAVGDSLTCSEWQRVMR